tara:strand:+ start:437 stop:718 length:282 start_codon:yes stop_codon:yes gene_type:complete
MVAAILSIIFLVVALYGYYSSIKISKLEKEIRKQGLDYECFECKKKFSVNETKCPHCKFITIYGKRKSKFWVILPILGIWIMVVAKWNKVGMF